jgi:hypothetical protein
MPRKESDLTWAKNCARYMSKKAKSDVEKRRWFDRFLVLAKLAAIALQDDPPAPGNNPDSTKVALPDLDSQAAEMLKRIQTGGDDGGNKLSTSQS